MTIRELIADCNGFTASPEQAENSYHKGLVEGPTFQAVTIATNNVWGADCKNGSSLSSYEKIGYHAGSVSYIKGILDSGCPVRVYRDGWVDLER